MKLCVGADSIDDLSRYIDRRTAERRRAKKPALYSHVTRMWPRREEELLGEGGSLYWVIKKFLCVRQEIAGLEEAFGDDGIRRCRILLQPALIPVQARPQRAFQGWRYLKDVDAPRDLSRTEASLAPELARELAELGLM